MIFLWYKLKLAKNSCHQWNNITVPEYIHYPPHETERLLEILRGGGGGEGAPKAKNCKEIFVSLASSSLVGTLKAGGVTDIFATQSLQARLTVQLLSIIHVNPSTYVICVLNARYAKDWNEPAGFISLITFITEVFLSMKLSTIVSRLNNNKDVFALRRIHLVLKILFV